MSRLEEWGINLNTKAKSITIQTIGYLVIFSTGILLALWFFQVLFLKFSYEHYQIKTINKISQKIVKSEDDLIEQLEQIAYENDICIELDTDMQILSFNTKKPTCILNYQSSTVNGYKEKVLNSSKTINTLKLVNQKYEAKGLLSAIKMDDYNIFLYTDLEDVNSTSAVLKNQLIYITLLAIIIAIVISLYLSHRLTLPIMKITSKVRDLGKDKKVEFEKSGIKEIDELAETLNYAQSEITKTDELRRDLMANVSHDLKTPLTMIKAYAEMIKDFSYKDVKKQKEHLDIIIDETDRLNNLVNDILLLSKSQAEVDQINIEEYDLVKELKNIIKKYEIIKETEDYKIIFTGPKKAVVHADKNKINQVIYNLINNAINYTGDNKEVKVVLTEKKDGYLLEIIDYGKGIKKEELNHIWDKYYKNEKNHRRNIVGTGLGLSIVKAILEHHNFEYGVKSTKNKGTTFYFTVQK